jgi:hypothetical protein
MSQTFSRRYWNIRKPQGFTQAENRQNVRVLIDR